MKLRLLVMNGQRIIQSEEEGVWKNRDVDKASGVKPGIYNIYNAVAADKTKTYDGVVVHVNDRYLYQQVNKMFVMHNRDDFFDMPEVGQNVKIGYDAKGIAKAVSATLKRSRSL